MIKITCILTLFFIHTTGTATMLYAYHSLSPPYLQDAVQHVLLEEYLKPTKLCDSDNPLVIKRARDQTHKIQSIQEKADNLWRYVSHYMFYAVGKGGYRDAKASDSFSAVRKYARMKGMDFNCSTAFIALARASGIPSRYKIVPINKKAYEYLYPPEQYKRLDEAMDHITAEVFINGEWKEYGIYISPRYIADANEYRAADIDAYALQKAFKKTRSVCNKEEQERERYMSSKGAQKNLTISLISRWNLVSEVILKMIEEDDNPTYSNISERIRRMKAAAKRAEFSDLTVGQVGTAVQSLCMNEFVKVSMIEELKKRIKEISARYRVERNKGISLAETVRLYNQKYPKKKFSNNESLRNWMKKSGIKGPEIGLSLPRSRSPFATVPEIRASVREKQRGKYKKYLMPSSLCDCDNVGIIRKTNILTRELRTDALKTDRIWEWLLKQMHFGVGYGAYWDMPASKTIAEIEKKSTMDGFGMSFNLANAFIAMARSIGIPGRFKIARVPKEQFKHLFSEKQFKEMDAFIFYVCAEVLLNDHWKEYDLFRADSPSLSGSENIVSSIDEFALRMSQIRSHKERDKEELLRQAFICAKKGKGRATMFLVEQSNTIVRAVHDIVQKKKRPIIKEVLSEIALLARSNPSVKKMTQAQVYNVLYFFGMVDIIAKEKTGIEPFIDDFKKIAKNFAGNHKRLPKPFEVVHIFNKLHPHDAILYPTFWRWIKTGDRYDEIGIAQPATVKIPRTSKQDASKRIRGKKVRILTKKPAPVLQIKPMPEIMPKPKEKLPYADLLLPGEIMLLFEDYQRSFPKTSIIDMLEKIEQDKHWAFLSVCVQKIESSNMIRDDTNNQRKVNNAKESLFQASYGNELSGVPAITKDFQDIRTMIKTFSVEQARRLIDYELNSDEKINRASREELIFAYEYLNRYISEILSRDSSLGTQGLRIFKTIGKILGRTSNAKIHTLPDEKLEKSIAVSP